MPALNTEELCYPTCRCRRCLELLHERAMKKVRQRRFKDYCRAGGKASGRKRRQLAKGKRPPRTRDREQALNLAYRRRQFARWQFNILYRRTYPTGYTNGCETLWQHYEGNFKLYRVLGQHFRTTNAQRAAYLANKHRPRCRRTVQRLNRRLGEMGLAKVSWYKDQRATPGHKDCLVVEICSPRIKNVTPPSGAGADAHTSLRSCSPHDETSARDGGNGTNDLSPPAAPAETEAATPPVTERDQVEQQLRFLQLKLDAGFGDPSVIRATMRHLKLEAQASGADLSRIGASNSRGFRCST